MAVSTRPWLSLLAVVGIVLFVALPTPSQQAHLPIKRVPVVFHVLHNGAVGNITDERIHREVEALNTLFRAQSNAYANRDKQFDGSIATDTGIRFVLAAKDPQGNDFTGITRTQTTFASTSIGFDTRFFEAGSNRGVAIFPSDQYVNIILHPNLQSPGFAFGLPSSTPHSKDAIVISTGDIDAAVNPGSHLARAFGGWMGLPFTFNGRSCFGSGDFIADTPQTDLPAISYVNITDPCPTNSTIAPSRCGSPTQIGNFMDFNFAKCAAYFSNGQFAVLRDLLTTGKGIRARLRFSPALPPVAGVCNPNCFLRECGPDGCGGFCGQCDQQSFCNNAGTCVFGTPLNNQCPTSSLLAVTTSGQVISTNTGNTGTQDSCSKLRTGTFLQHQSGLFYFFTGTGRRVRISTCLPRTTLRTYISVFQSNDCTLDKNECLGSSEAFGFADSCTAATSSDCATCVGAQAKAAQLDFCTQANQVYRFVISVGGDNVNFQPVDFSVIDLGTACTACTPDCGDKMCGPAPCGGSCGSCDAGTQTCNATGICVPNTNAHSDCNAAKTLAPVSSDSGNIFASNPVAPALPQCTVTHSTLVGNAFQPGKAVWYTFAVPAAGNHTLTIKSCSSAQDTRISLYRVNNTQPCNITEYKCIGQSNGQAPTGCVSGSQLTTCIAGGGQTYYILQDSVQGGVDSVTLSINATLSTCNIVPGPARKKNVIPTATTAVDVYHARNKRSVLNFGANFVCADALDITASPTFFGAGKTSVLFSDLPVAAVLQDAGCFPPVGRQLWYKFTGTGNSVTASTCSLKTTVAARVHITTSCSTSSSTCAAYSERSSCAAGANGGSKGIATVCTTANTAYWILVETEQVDLGQVQLTVTDSGAACAVAAASTCATAQMVLQNQPHVFDLSTTSLKRILSCNRQSLPLDGGDLVNGLWYVINPLAAGITHTLTTCATGFSTDTIINVYSIANTINQGNCDISSQVVCEGHNDDIGAAVCAANPAASRVSFCSRANRNYYALVSGKNTNSGEVQFSFTTTAGCAGVCAPTCTETTVCGPDGCGGFCGRFGGDSGCQAGSVCQNGQCNCKSDCNERECGNDICGNSCGKTCAAGLTCVAAKCSNTTINNDLCDDGIKITSVSTVLSSTFKGRAADTVPTCNTVSLDPPGAPGVWFFVAGNGQTWTITTCSRFTETDTKLFVFTGACGSLQCVTANDNDAGCSSRIDSSTVSFTTQPSQAYRVLVASTNPNSNSDFVITASSVGIGAILPDIFTGQTLQGGSITYQLEIDPIPTSPVTFTVRSANTQVVSTSHSQVVFTRGQQFATLTVSSSGNGRIGTTSISLQPDDANRYRVLTLSATVLGRMTVAAPSTCTGVGKTYDVEVTFVPPPPVAVTLLVAASNAQQAVGTVAVAAGQRKTTVKVLGVSPARAATVSFAGSPYISAATPEFDILGEIQSDLSSAALLTGALRQTTITFNPPPTTTTTFTFALAGGTVTPSTFVATPGTRTVLLDVVAGSPGSVAFTASGNGYCPFSRTITSTQSNLVCSAGNAAVTNGMACAPCPGGADNTCSNRGTCRFSKCLGTSTTCECFSGFTGYGCQFDSSNTNGSPVKTQALTSSSTTLNLGSADGLGYEVSVEIPRNVTGTGNGETAFLVPLEPQRAFFEAVDPNANQPQFSVQPVPSIGFSVEVLCADNTRLGNASIATASNPVRIHIENVRARRTVRTLSDEDFQFLDLFRWDGKQWVEVTSECPAGKKLYTTDLAKRTITALVCKMGQFQLFVVRPVGQAPPPVLARPVQTTTGITGFQPQAPPLPRFTPDDRRVSPPRRKPRVSGGVVFVPSVFVVLVVALLAAFIVAL